MSVLVTQMVGYAAWIEVLVVEVHHPHHPTPPHPPPLPPTLPNRPPSPDTPHPEGTDFLFQIFLNFSRTSTHQLQMNAVWNMDHKNLLRIDDMCATNHCRTKLCAYLMWYPTLEEETLSITASKARFFGHTCSLSLLYIYILILVGEITSSNTQHTVCQTFQEWGLKKINKRLPNMPVCQHQWMPC